ncbi:MULTISPECIES: hypothetical protein [unclassified Actinoplanes]|uniref:hypothetical protein n=1 Tax=unclassified Actinoplanes TaxID=2626549 RepID=UPI000311A562|nr:MULTISPECIES: hypothetical protein [unclassified Actinoplanes]
MASTYYLAMPLFGVLSLFGWLVIGGCWVGVVATSALAMLASCRDRAYGWAVACLVVAVLSGVGVVSTDWRPVYTDSQFRLHRGELGELAAEYQAGRLVSDSELPWRLRYLSIDGQAHVRDGALYLPVWADWRAESGGGFAYFPSSPGPDTMVGTAAGDTGRPVRALGDGWWWVD